MFKIDFKEFIKIFLKKDIIKITKNTNEWSIVKNIIFVKTETKNEVEIKENFSRQVKLFYKGNKKQEIYQDKINNQEKYKKTDGIVRFYKFFFDSKRIFVLIDFLEGSLENIKNDFKKVT